MPRFSKQHSLRQRKIGRRKPFIEHQINEHTGDRDIEPNRHCPFGDAPMPIPTAAEHRNKGEDDERESYKCEENVADQHCEVDSGDCAAGAEVGRAFAGVIMVDEITGEKCARRNDRNNHAGDMALPKIAPNKIPAGADEDGADKI